MREESIYWYTFTQFSGMPWRMIHQFWQDWRDAGNTTLEPLFSEDQNALIDTVDPEFRKYLSRLDRHLPNAEKGIDRCESQGIFLLTLADCEKDTGNNCYPQILIERMGGGAPPVLFCFGDAGILQEKTSAIIGSRDAEEESLQCACSLGETLGKKGWNVVSGAARGVDRAAMLGSLESGGKSTAVLPIGICRAHEAMGELATHMENPNLLTLSPYAPWSGWSAGNALARNKIITAFSEFTIVAECGTKGGSWRAACGGLDQGVPVWVRFGLRAGDAGPENLKRRGGDGFVWDGEALPLINMFISESKSRTATANKTESRLFS